MASNTHGESEDNDEESEKQLESIRKKLKTSHKKLKAKESKASGSQEVDEDNELEEYYLHKDRDNEKKVKMEELKKEIQSVKKEYHQNKMKKDDEKKELAKDDKEKSETFKEYKEEVDMYKSRKKSLPKKGAGREEFTLQLLESFKKRLHNVKEMHPDSEEPELKSKDDDVDTEENWLNHKLQFTDNSVLAKDANMKDDDWFEIYDPRNPLNKRRRGETSAKSTK